MSTYRRHSVRASVKRAVLTLALFPAAGLGFGIVVVSAQQSSFNRNWQRQKGRKGL
jgi:hypothetical protein